MYRDANGANEMHKHHLLKADADDWDDDTHSDDGLQIKVFREFGSYCTSESSTPAGD